jgi:hypothetical protein
VNIAKIGIEAFTCAPPRFSGPRNAKGPTVRSDLL